MIKDLLLVGLGGGIGSMLRFAAGSMFSHKQFPWATFTINILGSLLIGMVIALSIRHASFAANWKTILAAGICGGFTTFSAFTAENMSMLQSGKIGIAAIYVISSVLLGIAACFAGYSLLNKL
jgi:fluoride exporter